MEENCGAQLSAIVIICSFDKFANVIYFTGMMGQLKLDRNSD